MIHFERISDGIEDELERLIAGPSAADLLAFEGVLTSQFQATQQAVHVITGSLKSSGRVSSSNSQSKWEGTISYGGPSTGVHNPVKYAEYEREKDGLHDFLAPAKAMENQYIAAMNAYLGG